MRLFLFITFVFSFSAFAGSAIQTDWSGGQWHWGPVIDLGSDFLLDTGTNWSSFDGLLILSPEETIVDGDFDGPCCVFAADLDEDGDNDVLGAAWEEDDITWWENVDGSGDSWSEHLIYNSFSGARCVFAADIDGDGDNDVLGAAAYADGITWWENIDGSGNSWSEHLIVDDYDVAASVLATDLDGDGDNDVLGTELNSVYPYLPGEITWWENVDGSGNSWSEHLIDDEFDDAKSLFAADLDGDCDEDVLATAAVDDDITWRENVDCSVDICSEHLRDVIYYAIRYVFAADIDGDGDIDVLGASTYEDAITWWENVDGSGENWSEHLIDDSFIGASWAFTTDVDGDGDTDILGAAYYDDDITWWENLDGSGENWSEHFINDNFNGANRVFAADLDGDGDNDVLGTAWDEADITWWENVDGSGDIWSEHLIDNYFEGPQSVFAADINGDGCHDVLGAGFCLNDITWWNLSSFSPTGSLESSLLDTQCSPDWSEINWNGDCPAGTELGFQVRANETGWEPTMPEWSDTLWTPCSLEGILPEGYPYVQYRVVMETSDPSITPTLYDVTLSWDETGVEDHASPVVSSTEFLPFSPNPASGLPVARFALTEPTDVEFTVFNISGRVVDRASASGYPAGYGSLFMSELPPGLYICRMTSGGFSGTRRFVVID